MFINTPIFYRHKQIFYLPKITSEEDKNKFICTSDAYLEASNFGHSFAIAIGEYCVNNKPIITYNGWTWNQNHFKILGDKAIKFKSGDEFHKIITTFNPKEYEKLDNNCYKEFTPEKVMQKFKEVFIDSPTV